MNKWLVLKSPLIAGTLLLCAMAIGVVIYTGNSLWIVARGSGVTRAIYPSVGVTSYDNGWTYSELNVWRGTMERADWPDIFLEIPKKGKFPLAVIPKSVFADDPRFRREELVLDGRMNEKFSGVYGEYRYQDDILVAVTVQAESEEAYRADAVKLITPHDDAFVLPLTKRQMIRLLGKPDEINFVRRSGI